MNGFIYKTAYKLAFLLGQDGIFLTFLAVLVLCFMINVLLACLVADYGIKKRLWQPCVCSFSVLISAGICSIANFGAYIPLFLAGISFLTLIPVFLIRTKNFKVTKKQRDLVKFIDNEIKFASKQQDSDCFCEKISVDKPSIKADTTKKEKSVLDFDLDFQHVKSVIKRLDYFGLKESDKKQVKELENALNVAERGDFGQETKSKINDGLGALLKIMSKYGV